MNNFSEYTYYFKVQTNLNKSLTVYVKENGYNFLNFAFEDKNGKIQMAKYERNNIDVKILISAFLQEFGIIADSIKNAQNVSNNNE